MSMLLGPSPFSWQSVLALAVVCHLGLVADESLKDGLEMGWGGWGSLGRLCEQRRRESTGVSLRPEQGLCGGELA